MRTTAGRRRIVALAGTLCSPEIFDPLAAALADVASIDAESWMTWPGPWDVPSLADRLAARLREQSGPVVLIGHSTGGAIAQQLTLERPDLVAALVLVDTGPNMHAHGDVDAIIRTLEQSWGPSLVASILDRSFQQPLTGDVRDRFLAYADGIEPRAASEVLRSQRAIDFTDRLGAISCPTVVIHGTEDPTRTVTHARQFAGAIPGAVLHLLPTGHSPMYEQPDAVAAIMRDVIGGNRAVPAPPKPFEVHPSGAYLHGTKADLRVGDLLVTGHPSNFEAGLVMRHVYVTQTVDAATWGAELAVGDGRGRIYVVEPTGPIEDDPNVTDKKFPGNPTRSYRTTAPVRIVGELTDWVGHSAEQVATMRTNLARMANDGSAEILD